MSWKRGFAIALCSCALWLYADRTARADDGPPKDDKAPRARQKSDEPPPGPPHVQRDAGPRDEEFDPPGPPAGEDGPPGPPRNDRMGPPGQPTQVKVFIQRQDEPGPQGPPMNQPPGMMQGGVGGGILMRTDGNNMAYQQIPPSGMPGAGRGMPGMPPGAAGGMSGRAAGGMMGGMPGMGYGPIGQDPEMYEFMKREAELNQKVQELVDKYRNLSNTPRGGHGDVNSGEIQKQIEKLVSEQFELRQERRQKELAKFEEQIKRLRTTIEKREKLKTEIIDRRVKELLGQDDDTRF